MQGEQCFFVALQGPAVVYGCTMMVVCPKCDVALILLEFGGIEVDYCSRCEGLWLDSGEFEQLLLQTGGRANDPLVRFAQARTRRETGRPVYLCPRCDRPLAEVVRADGINRELRLDRCPRGDGIWFDKDELLDLLEALPPEAEATGALALLKDVLGEYLIKQGEQVQCQQD